MIHLGNMNYLYMDNHYSAPELSVLLREIYQIMCCGTIRNNRKGWNMMVINLSKMSARGSSLVKYDPVNHILFGKSNDNKVVSFISTLGVSGKVTVSRCIGSKKIDFEIEEAHKRYTHSWDGCLFHQESSLQEVVSYGASRHF